MLAFFYAIRLNSVALLIIIVGNRVLLVYGFYKSILKPPRKTRDAMGFRAIDNLDAVFAGREPRDRVA